MIEINLKKVAVVGGGLMGTGIALSIAQYKNEVTIIELDSNSALSTQENINDILEKEVQKEKMSSEDLRNIKSNITVETKLSFVKNKNLVIEAVPEDIKIKQKIHSNIAKFIDDTTIVATNTSGLSIAKISSYAKKPENFIGFHYFYPANKMKLIEVIPSLLTNDQITDLMVNFAKSLNKEPILCNDYSGFTVNRILVPMINEAIFCVMEGNAVEDVDKAMEFGANHPMGPLSLADFVGLDTLLATLESLHEGFGDSKYRPCPLLVKLVESNNLGKKTGKGFYEYTEAGEKTTVFV